MPAKSLFPRPRPDDLITVPACAMCNEGYSKDEEYFVLALLHQAAGFSDPAGRVLDELLDPKKVKRRSALLVSLGSDVRIVKGRLAVRLRVTRINRVLRKIVRGLFFHEFGRRVPDDMHVEVEIDPPPGLLRHEGTQMALLQPSRWRGGSVFEWKVLAAKDNPNATAWVMRFYDSINAWAVVVSQSKLRPR